MRGEYKELDRALSRSTGSPLLARGVLVDLDIQQYINRITPACAGSTKMVLNDRAIDKDHPCLRGEYFLKLINKKNVEGSPLLARGVLSRFRNISI